MLNVTLSNGKCFYAVPSGTGCARTPCQRRYIFPIKDFDVPYDYDWARLNGPSAYGGFIPYNNLKMQLIPFNEYLAYQRLPSNIQFDILKSNINPCNL